MEVLLVDHMGDDLSVVNAARVSYSKKATWGWNDGTYLKDKDVKLVNYLAKHNHWSPFGHASMQFHIKAPVFVARQLVKHQVGLSWNEISRRYVDYEPEYYMPQSWRLRAEDKKQGSSDETIEYDIANTIKIANTTYTEMLEKGIAPELARMVLPQSMMTEWIWSGSVYAFARVCNLRCKPDTQKETQEVAWKIHDIADELFPYCWKYLRS